MWFSCRILSKKLSKKGTRYAAWGEGGWYHLLPTEHGNLAAGATRRILQDKDFPPRKRERTAEDYCHYIREARWNRKVLRVAKDARHIPRAESRARQYREGARSQRERSQPIRHDKIHHVGLRCLRAPGRPALMLWCVRMQDVIQEVATSRLRDRARVTKGRIL